MAQNEGQKIELEEEGEGTRMSHAINLMSDANPFGWAWQRPETRWVTKVNKCKRSSKAAKITQEEETNKTKTANKDPQKLPK